jgi:site-specific recombinase XerD
MKEISRIDILNIINTMQENGLLETAGRLLNYIERIFKYAVIYNIVEHNIIADIDKKNAVKRPKVDHLPALTKENEIKQLLRDIREIRKCF